MIRLLSFLALVASASATGTCKVGYNGQCSSFNGQNIKQAFPSNCYVPLATGACGSDSWLIFLNTFTMTFNVRYEGFIYSVDNGTTFSRSEFSVALNLAGTVATITATTVPSNTCGLCNNNGKPECLSPITTTPLPTTTVKPTTTEETTTVAVPSAPPSTCTVFTSGVCTGFNGCNSTTSFPPNDNVLLAMGACEGETWVVFYSTITMSFNIRFEGFIYPCHGGNKTVFGSVSVEVNIEVTMAIILVGDKVSDNCGLCGSESIECSSSTIEAVISSEVPSITEESTSSVATSEASSEVPPSTCVISTGGECTGFNGCSSTTTFPEHAEIILAKGDCEAEDTWIIFYSTITMSFNIKFEGFIHPCNPGNKTVFGAVSVEVNIEVTMAIILVGDMPSGVDCGLCGSETVECSSSSSSPALTSTEEPTSSVATTEDGDCGCAGFCMVSISGGSISFDGSEFEGDYPEDCILPLASSDCSGDKKWQILMSKATSSFFLVVDGEIIVLGFGSIYMKYEMTVFVTYQTVFVVLPGKSLENDCSVCGKPNYKECIDFPGLPSTPYPWVTKAPSTIPPCVFPSSLSP